MDVHSPEQRSYNMSQIRGKNTGPEITLRKWLWREGLRYRLHRKDLPGKPDIVFPKYRTVLLVHGCFWHRHSCKAATMPASNQHFWIHKFEMTIERDRRNARELRRLGWRVLTVWECALKKQDAEIRIPTRIKKFLESSGKTAVIE